MNNKKKAIILNHMFTGDFLNKNIGHEVINLFPDDKGENFIYLCKDGSFNRTDIDIENSYVVQVQRPPKSYKTLEVVSVAVGLESLELDDNDFKNGAYEPTYGHVNISKIFANNIQKQDRYLTFKAKTVFLPKRSVYIYHGEKDAVKSDAHLQNYNPSQMLREYIFEDTPDYEQLLRILPALNQASDTELWQVRTPSAHQEYNGEEKARAVDIYGIQTRELSYSNALAYYINKYPQYFKDIFQSLKTSEGDVVNNLPEESPVVHREWNNIDIIFNWGKYVFVIENKICSGINGKQNGGGTQLVKYQDLISREIKKKDSIFYQQTPVFIFLTPNHNDIALTDKEQAWTKVYYRNLFEALKRKANQLSDEEDYLFKDFVKALADQAFKNLNESIMKRKFKCAIQSVKK